MNWEIVTKAKQNGGLGIWLTRKTNIVILGKLVWDIKQNHKRQISTPRSQNVTTAKHTVSRVLQ